MILENGNIILENKNYYRHILMKPKNIDKYYSVSAIIYYSNNIYKLTTRLYKIRGFTSDIPLDYIYKSFVSILSPDIVNIIMGFYLQNDVSFNSIDQENSYKTIKFVSNIKYSSELSKYQTSLEYPPNNKNILIETLVNSLSSKFLDLLNHNYSFDINSIFSIKNNQMDLCNIHKITNKNIAWGIQLQ